MPIYQIDVEKSFAGEFWTNVYYVNIDGTLAGAGLVAAEIAGIERTFHKEDVLFTKARARTLELNDFNFVNVPLGYNGSTSSGSNVPLFCTMNVVFALETGRPARKYYRGVGFSNSLTTDGQSWNTALLNIVNSAIQSFITPDGLSSSPLVDRDGDAVVSAVAQARVGMHQLRRGSRRRATPVLP